MVPIWRKNLRISREGTVLKKGPNIGEKEKVFQKWQFSAILENLSESKMTQNGRFAIELQSVKNKICSELHSIIYMPLPISLT